MKKLLLILSVSFTLLACDKDDDPAPPPPADKYMSTSVGSTWNYSYTDNNNAANSENYVRTSTNRDTTVSGKIYHIFTSDNGETEYQNVSGNDYFTMQALPLGLTDTMLVNLYLKDNAAGNFTWEQSYTLDAGVPVEIKLTNKIQEKGISRMVGGKNYTDVIHVKTTIDVPILATMPGSSIVTDIHYYYAPKVGMIENSNKIDLVAPLLTIDEHIDTKTTLTSSIVL